MDWHPLSAQPAAGPVRVQCLLCTTCALHRLLQGCSLKGLLWGLLHALRGYLEGC